MSTNGIITHQAVVVDRACIPLRLAALCLDCESVFPLNPDGCPACGGTSLFPLGKWLARRRTP